MTKPFIIALRLVPAYEVTGSESILIITSYRQQKRLLEQVLLELSPTEIPRDVVSVRAINDSLSRQAEIVICDFMRSRKPGILCDDRRLAMMTTSWKSDTVSIWREFSDRRFAQSPENIRQHYPHHWMDRILQSLLHIWPHQRRLPREVYWFLCQQNHAGRHCKDAAEVLPENFANVANRFNRHKAYHRCAIHLAHLNTIILSISKG